MSKETDEFFEGKRPWSKIKDRILGSYLNPYLAKVSKRGKPILLIDGFAGPGTFEDKSPGSPLLISQAAKKYAEGNYRAIFINNKRKYHEKLESILQKSGWYPASQAMMGDSGLLLQEIANGLTDETVFLYLDPFGLDCNFSTLEPFINRNSTYSTEIVINLSVPIIHRLAGREKAQEGTIDPELQRQRFELLTAVLGGDYWKAALLTPNIETKEREQMVIHGYMERLSKNGYLRFTGACPIQATRDGATKYYMVFASPHRDARRLFNDEMLKAFNDFMTQQEMRDTLFADLSWRDWRDTKELNNIVVSYVKQHPGHTRLDLWHIILQEHFLRFTESEYRNAVQTLHEDDLIFTPTQHSRKRLNDNCVLLPKPEG